MLTNYYVNINEQPTGEHEVHKDWCSRLPSIYSREFLGCFYNSDDAVKEARKFFKIVDGCYYCSPESHRM